MVRPISERDRFLHPLLWRELSILSEYESDITELVTTGLKVDLENESSSRENSG
jgi:hypothetical protein